MFELIHNTFRKRFFVNRKYLEWMFIRVSAPGLQRRFEVNSIFIFRHPVHTFVYFLKVLLSFLGKINNYLGSQYKIIASY